MKTLTLTKLLSIIIIPQFFGTAINAFQFKKLPKFYKNILYSENIMSYISNFFLAILSMMKPDPKPIPPKLDPNAPSKPTDYQFFLAKLDGIDLQKELCCPLDYETYDKACIAVKTYEDYFKSTKT